MSKSLELNKKYISRCLELARQGMALGEVPIGALIVHQGKVIAEAHNLKESRGNPTFHAEILAIQAAAETLGRWRLNDCELFVSLEPCLMCAGAIVQARLDGVFYGAKDPKAGAVESLYQILSDNRLNHRPKVEGGILAEDCGSILSQFFKAKRS